MVVIRAWPRHVHGTRLNRSILISLMFSPLNSLVAVRVCKSLSQHKRRAHVENKCLAKILRFRITEDRRPSTNLFWLGQATRIATNRQSSFTVTIQLSTRALTHVNKRSINTMKCRNRDRVQKCNVIRRDNDISQISFAHCLKYVRTKRTRL